MRSAKGKPRRVSTQMCCVCLCVGACVIICDKTRDRVR